MLFVHCEFSVKHETFCEFSLRSFRMSLPQNKNHMIARCWVWSQPSERERKISFGEFYRILESSRRLAHHIFWCFMFIFCFGGFINILSWVSCIISFSQKKNLIFSPFDSTASCVCFFFLSFLSTRQSVAVFRWIKSRASLRSRRIIIR